MKRDWNGCTWPLFTYIAYSNKIRYTDQTITMCYFCHNQDNISFIYIPYKNVHLKGILKLRKKVLQEYPYKKKSFSLLLKIIKKKSKKKIYIYIGPFYCRLSQKRCFLRGSLFLGKFLGYKDTVCCVCFEIIMFIRIPSYFFSISV